MVKILKVVQKMKARLELGYWPFMPPQALVNKKDPVHGKILVPHEPYATIYKQAIEKFRDGLLITPEEVREFIGKEFSIADVGTKPALSTVQSILTNVLYAGYIEYPDWNIPRKKARHEGFISIETFSAVQERLKGRSKQWVRRDANLDFPLKPNVFCTQCNKPYTAAWNKGRSAYYPNYWCKTAGCPYRYKVVKKNKMEGEFEELLLKVKPADEVFDLANFVFKEQWNEYIQQYQDTKYIAGKEQVQIEENIDALMKRVAKTNDDSLAETYEGEIKKLLIRKKSLEETTNTNYYTEKEFGSASDKVIAALKKPLDMWKSDEYSDKRTILFMYFEEQLRYDYNLGFGSAGLAYPIKLISQIGQAKTEGVDIWRNNLDAFASRG